MSDARRPSTTLPAAAQPVAPPPAPPTQTTRDRVVELLTQHYANDRVALDEFERRTTAAFAARSTDELQALVADLAGPVLPAIIPEHGRISAILSSNEQHGAMVVPPYLEIVAVFMTGRAIFGSVEATIAAPRLPAPLAAHALAPR